MRLIDVDKIEINEECTFSGRGIKAFLDAIPTAYIVDKDVEQLKSYKSLEEQGKLLKLPYALNDTVYYFDDFTPFEDMPIEGRISGFRVTWCGTIVIHITTNFNDKGCLADRKDDIDVVDEDFGN